MPEALNPSARSFFRSRMLRPSKTEAGFIIVAVALLPQGLAGLWARLQQRKEAA